MGEARFEFGQNWQAFSPSIDGERLAQAQQSLSALFGTRDLAGRTFLDIGCGSGLFSLAARTLGARVTSFDYDRNSVACTEALRDQYAPGDPGWSVLRGSILDADFLRELGRFDLVYSWGVLHHTGAMWEAFGNAAELLEPGGTLAIALYRRTPLCGAWKIEKRLYARSPAVLQATIRGIYKLAFFAAIAATGRNPIAYVRSIKSNRGMSWHHDVHDWLGGYPYESATPGDVTNRASALGLLTVQSAERASGLDRLGLFGSGCAEYVFVRQ